MLSAKTWLIFSAVIAESLFDTQAFLPQIHPRESHALYVQKKRRRRKSNTLDSVTQDPVKEAQEIIEGIEQREATANGPSLDDVGPSSASMIGNPTDASGFTLKPDDMLQSPSSTTAEDKTAIPLPDIKEARKRKQLEEEVARFEQEQEKNRPKISRKDKEAFVRLLEQQPYSDADDTLFEEEAYGTISALLGERAKPFLSIPVGPLQVGHFIGALGIVLMAFVEYPGFPLTNLPTPLRDALQGGLATVYSINLLLAVYAAYKATERGQPVLLWVAKTFSVGGLALDQLTQLPTLKELETVNPRRS